MVQHLLLTIAIVDPRTGILDSAEEHLLTLCRLVLLIEHGRRELMSHLDLVCHGGMVFGAVERRVSEHLSRVPSFQGARVVFVVGGSHDLLEKGAGAAGSLNTPRFLKAAIEHLLGGGGGGDGLLLERTGLKLLLLEAAAARVLLVLLDLHILRCSRCSLGCGGGCGEIGESVLNE